MEQFPPSVKKMKILHRYNVSPPANSVPTTALPLTFFDILFILCCPAQRVFFYDFPQSHSSFTQTTLPLLVHSLSLCLRRFFPFAGNLVVPPAPPQKPYILYSDGDSLSLTVAESDADFAKIVSDEPQDAALIHPMLPQLPALRASDGACVGPLMAIQVTLFPNKGICIGVQFLHVAADGWSFHHFMKSWASIYKSGGDPASVESDDSTPFHDRAVIKDPNGLEPILLKDWWSSVGLGSSPSPTPTPSEALLAVADKVRATFVLQKAHLDGLKAQISSQLNNDGLDSESDPIQLSTFVVTSAFVWVCIIKSKYEEHERCTERDQSSGDDDKLCHFVFLADCRGRLEYPIPSTYFGNCLDICFVLEKRSMLLGKNGILHAARAIGRRVKEVGLGGALRGGKGWIRDLNTAVNGDVVIVAGSPRLKVYDTDFGWGRLRKSHVVHTDVTGATSLAETRDADGGVEVGLALTRLCMDKFVSLFEKGLQSFMPL